MSLCRRCEASALRCDLCRKPVPCTVADSTHRKHDGHPDQNTDDCSERSSGTGPKSAIAVATASSKKLLPIELAISTRASCHDVGLLCWCALESADVAALFSAAVADGRKASIFLNSVIARSGDSLSGVRHLRLSTRAINFHLWSGTYRTLLTT
jgi:hypothetical protein